MRAAIDRSSAPARLYCTTIRTHCSTSHTPLTLRSYSCRFALRETSTAHTETSFHSTSLASHVELTRILHAQRERGTHHMHTIVTLSGQQHLALERAMLRTVIETYVLIRLSAGPPAANARRACLSPSLSVPIHAIDRVTNPLSESALQHAMIACIVRVRVASIHEVGQSRTIACRV
jgi:hypothetical protein